MKWYQLMETYQDVAKDEAWEDFKFQHNREPEEDEWEVYLEESEFESDGTLR